MSKRIPPSLSGLGFGVVLVGLTMTSPCLAAEPVALVEDVVGSPAKVAVMDYLSPGQVLHLATGQSLVLDYFGSCLRESVAGGTVTVGERQSKVEGGSVTRETVACDGGPLKLTADQAAKSGVLVFRSVPKPPARPTEAQIHRTLYGASPLVELAGGGPLVIERIGVPGDRLELTVGKNDLLRGVFYDFAAVGRALVPGAVYRASAGGRSVVFRIDPNAKAGRTPPVGRLLTF